MSGKLSRNGVFALAVVLGTAGPGFAQNPDEFYPVPGDEANLPFIDEGAFALRPAVDSVLRNAPDLGPEALGKFDELLSARSLAFNQERAEQLYARWHDVLTEGVWRLGQLTQRRNLVEELHVGIPSMYERRSSVQSTNDTTIDLLMGPVGRVFGDPAVYGVESDIVLLRERFKGTTDMGIPNRVFESAAVTALTFSYEPWSGYDRGWRSLVTYDVEAASGGMNIAELIDDPGLLGIVLYKDLGGVDTDLANGSICPYKLHSKFRWFHDSVEVLMTPENCESEVPESEYEFPNHHHYDMELLRIFGRVHRAIEAATPVDVSDRLSERAAVESFFWRLQHRVFPNWGYEMPPQEEVESKIGDELRRLDHAIPVHEAVLAEIEPLVATLELAKDLSKLDESVLELLSREEVDEIVEEIPNWTRRYQRANWLKILEADLRLNRGRVNSELFSVAASLRDS